MPKQLLTGTLEEQCDFLYRTAQEKIAAGNYTGAQYALKEIARYAPDFRDTADLLAMVQQRKVEQRFLVLMALLGAVAFVGLAALLQLPNDLWKLAAAAAGLLAGYGMANFLLSLRSG